MTINPIFPIPVIAVICVLLLFFKRKGFWPFIRQIIIVALVFLINLRVMIPVENAESEQVAMDLNVLFVVDDTISMLARDYNGETERLAAAKEDCSYIINELYGSRFSVITFNNDTYQLSPFTDNADHVRNMINSIYPVDQFYAKGTSINICKEVFINALKHQAEKRGKVVVFFISDGEITTKESLSSFKDAAEYISNGAVLGYGTEAGGKMYMKESYSDRIEVIQDKSDWPYTDAISKIDETNLRKLAADMGIEYVNMNSRAGLDAVIKEAKKDATTGIGTKIGVGYADIYFYFAIPLILLLVFEFIDYKRRA